MSSFFFGPPSSTGRETDQIPPEKEEFEYLTMKKVSTGEEKGMIYRHIEHRMGPMPYMVRSEWEFPYLYENAANGLQRSFTAYGFTVDYAKPNGRRGRTTFYFRFLPSPMYEIEMQKEYDMRKMEEMKRMRVKEIDAKKDVIAEEEKSRKVARELSDEEALRSFQKAKMIAEQNASVPPTMDSFEAGPLVIPLTEDDNISEERDRKDEKDAKKKDKEMQMLNSFLRNKERIKGLKAAGKSPSSPSGT